MSEEAVLALVVSLHDGLGMMCQGLQDYMVSMNAKRDASPQRKKKVHKEKRKKSKSPSPPAAAKTTEPKRASRPKKPRDPNSPKAPKSALCRFRDDPEVRASYKKRYPNFSKKDMLRTMSDKFAKMSDEQKWTWTEPYAAEHAVYKKLKADYDASKNGKPSVIPVAVAPVAAAAKASSSSSSSSNEDDPFFT